MELDSKTIQKYSKFTTPKLKVKAQIIFNKWVVNRDKELRCISCGSGNQLQAGHFYAAGTYNHMRFLEDNVNIQCCQCNFYKHGNLIHYRANLIKKIGLERVEKLDLLAADKGVHKDNRYLYIEILIKYKL